MILYAKIAAIAIALGIAYWKGYDTMRDKHLLFVAEVESIGKAQEQANQHAIEVAEIITETVKNEYELKIAGLRTRYAGANGVCKPAGPGGNRVPPTTTTTGRTDGTPSDPEFIAKCAVTTQQLVSLQQWITKQQEHQK